MGGMIGDLISSDERIRENPPLKDGHDQIKCQEFQLIRVFVTDRSRHHLFSDIPNQRIVRWRRLPEGRAWSH
jgi:hypothetical protein